MSKIVQVTLRCPEELLERIDDCVEHYENIKLSRTQFILWSILEHVKRTENHGPTEITEIPQ